MAVTNYHAEPVFNLRHLASSKPFQEARKAFEDVCDSVGCSIPKDGFKGPLDFDNWKIAYSIAAQNKRRVLGESQELPPIYYYEAFKKMMLAGGFNPEDGEHVSFIEGLVFFNDASIFVTPLETKLEHDERTGEEKLWVRIFPWTRRDDIARQWSNIAERQRELKGFQSKSRPILNEMRDLELLDASSKPLIYPEGREPILNGHLRILEQEVRAGRKTPKQFEAEKKNILKMNPDAVRLPEPPLDPVQMVAADHDISSLAAKKALYRAKKRTKE